jgi:hypothetical protein
MQLFKEQMKRSKQRMNRFGGWISRFEKQMNYFGAWMNRSNG